VNHIRRTNPALQSDRSLRFHGSDNPEIMVYSKTSADGANVVLTVVNLDPHWSQSGWIDLDLAALGIAHDQGFQVHDLLGDGRYLWHGSRNFVQLEPHVLPAHVFVLRRRERSEQDFDYFV
jgi:starch synthase (maltosyl-transferring)